MWPATCFNIAVGIGVGGALKDSLVVCNQIRTVDTSRFGGRLGTLPEAVMLEVDRGLKAILDL